MEQTKVCNVCEIEKKLSEFYKQKTGKFGVRAYCKECAKSYQKKHNKENYSRKKEYDKKYMQEYRKTEKGKKHQIISNANHKAMKKALPYKDGGDEWYYVLNKYDNKCPVTGSSEIDLEHFIPLSWGHGGSLRTNIYPMNSLLNKCKQSKNPFIFMQSLTIEQQYNFKIVVHNLAKENGLSYEEFEQFVNWCELNQRSVAQIKNDNEKGLTSIDLWKLSTQNTN